MKTTNIQRVINLFTATRGQATVLDTNGESSGGAWKLFEAAGANTFMVSHYHKNMARPENFVNAGSVGDVRASREFASLVWIEMPAAAQYGNLRAPADYYLRKTIERPLVARDGYIVMVIDKNDYNEDWIFKISKACQEIAVYDVPEDQSVVLVGKCGVRQKNRKALAKQLFEQEPLDLATAPTGVYDLPPQRIPDERIMFHSVRMSSTEKLNAVNAFGGHLKAGFQEWIKVGTLTFDQPAANTRVQHMLSSIEAGAIENAVIEDLNGNLAVMRSVLRYTENSRVITKVDEDDGSEEELVLAEDSEMVAVRRMMKATIVLTYPDGVVRKIDSQELLELIIKNKETLVDQLVNLAQPKFDIAADEATYVPKAKWLPVIRNFKVKGKHPFRPAQEVNVAAAMHLLYDTGMRGLSMVFQPSFGKSAMGAVIMNAAHKQGLIKKGQVCIVISPGHLLSKWEREIKTMNPSANILKVSLKDAENDQRDMIREVAEFMRKAEASTALNVLVMHQDSIKLGEGTEPALMQRLDKKVFKPADPVTGMFVEQYRGTPARWATGREFVGLTRTVDIYGQDMFVNTFREYEGHELPCWQEIRRYRKPQLSKSLRDQGYKTNGRIVYTEYEHELFAARWHLVTLYNGYKGVRAQFWERRIPTEDVNEDRTKRLYKIEWYEMGTDPSMVEDGAEIVPTSEDTRWMPMKVIVKKDIADAGETDPWLAARGTRYKMNPRAELYKILNRYKGRIAQVHADEVHESAKIGGDRFNSLLHICSQAQKVLFWTGTYINGYSDFLYGLEAIINPKRLFLHYPWGESGRARWNTDMGVLEEMFKQSAQDAQTGSFTGVDRQSLGTPNQRPGVSCLVVPWMSDHTLFGSLSDLGAILPAYNEQPMPLAMNKDLEDSMTQASAIWGHTKVSMMSRFTYQRMWLTNPFMPMEVHYIERTYGADGRVVKQERKLAGICQPMPTNVILPKEEEMLKYVKASISAGRGTAVYVLQTDKRDLRPRLKQLIESNVQGAKVAVLTTSVHKTMREEWIDAKTAEGYNVLITHPAMVSTGLDLLGYPDVWWHETTLQLALMVQASARGYRIPQVHPCSVRFPYYKDTSEEVCQIALAVKKRALMILNGDEISIETEDSQSVVDIIRDAMRQRVSVDLEAVYAQINASYQANQRVDAEAEAEKMWDEIPSMFEDVTPSFAQPQQIEFLPQYSVPVAVEVETQDPAEKVQNPNLTLVVKDGSRGKCWIIGGKPNMYHKTLMHLGFKRDKSKGVYWLITEELPDPAWDLLVSSY